MSNVSIKTFWYQTGAVPGNDRRDSYKYYPPDAPSEYMKILSYITNLSTPSVAVSFNSRGFAWAANYKESNLRLSTTSSVLFEIRKDGLGNVKLSEIADMMLGSTIKAEDSAAFDETKPQKFFLSEAGAGESLPYEQLVNGEIDAPRKEFSKIAERLLGGRSDVCSLPDVFFPRTCGHLGTLLKRVPDFIQAPSNTIYFTLEKRPQVDEISAHARFLAGLWAVSLSRPDLENLPRETFYSLFGDSFDAAAFEDESNHLYKRMEKFGEIRKNGAFINWFAEYLKKEYQDDFKRTFGAFFQRFRGANYRRAFNAAICVKHFYASTHGAFNFEGLMDDWIKMWYSSGFYNQKDADFIENPTPLSFLDSHLTTETNDAAFAEYLREKERALGYDQTKGG